MTNDRYGHGLDHAMDEWNLTLHALRHLRPLRLIGFEFFVPLCRPFFIEDDRQAIGRMLAKHFQEHSGKTVDGIRLLPFELESGGNAKNAR